MKSIKRLSSQASEVKLLSAFALLVIVAIAPLSTAAFAQFSSYDQSGISVIGIDSDGVTIAPDEPDVLPPEPPQSGDVMFDGTTEGWIIVDKIAYQSDITISGVAYHFKDGIWNIEATGVISVVDRFAELELTGFAVDDILVLTGKGAIDTGEPIRVFLRGHFAPTLESGVFALAFTHAGIYNEDTGVRYPLMQTGFVNVYPIIVDPLPEPIPMPEPAPVIEN